eukprot:gene19961-7066_t
MAADDPFNEMDDAEYEEMLLSKCWTLLATEYRSALGVEDSKDALTFNTPSTAIELAKRGELIPECEQHTVWIRKASLVWWDRQFTNGGVWQTLYNMRCWPVAVNLTAHKMETYGAPKHAELLRKTWDIWEGLTEADQKDFLKMGALSAPHVSMKLDEHLMGFSDLLWGTERSSEQEGEESLVRITDNMSLLGDGVGG